MGLRRMNVKRIAAHNIEVPRLRLRFRSPVLLLLLLLLLLLPGWPAFFRDRSNTDPHELSVACVLKTPTACVLEVELPFPTAAR